MDIRKLKPVRSLKRLKENVTFYLLYGFRYNPAAIYNSRPYSDSFLRNKKTSQWNQLWAIAKSISNEYVSSENIMGMIFEGWKHFDGKDIHAYFFSHDDLKLRMLYHINTVRLMKCIFAGKDDRDWYSKTVATFKNDMASYDFETVITLFAITSPMGDPSYNLWLTIKAYESLVDPDKSLLELNCFDSVKNILLELETGEFEQNLNKVTRRKIANHLKALRGQSDAVTVDQWILNACMRGKIYFWKATGKYYTKCRKCEYDVIEKYFRSLAQVSGYAARQITAMAWSGARRLEGKNTESDMKVIILKGKKKGYIK